MQSGTYTKDVILRLTISQDETANWPWPDRGNMAHDLPEIVEVSGEMAAGFGRMLLTVEQAPFEEAGLPEDGEDARFLELFRNAPEATKARVIETLEADKPSR